MPNIRHIANVGYLTIPLLLEEVKILPVDRVITDSKIATNEFHVPNLTLSTVTKCPVFIPSIIISIHFATFTGE